MKKVLALIIAVLMLSSLVVVSTAAEETNWEAVTASLGLNHYVGAATTTAPTVDGVVNAGEYPFSFRNGTKTIYNYTGGEIQSAVTEYIAHDANYVYYAVEFVQANDNRAFQWQFKPFNDFDIFRDNSDFTKYYYTRVSWQARYKVDDEGSYTDYAGSFQPSINDNCVRVPTATETTDELYCVSGKNTETNLKTYEVRLSKAYLAEVNDCEIADLRGFAYFTYFHSSAAVGHIFTEDDLLAISDVDYTVFLPSANELGYRFIVLADVSTAPDGYVAPVAGEDYPTGDGGDVIPPPPPIDDQQSSTTTTTTTTTNDETTTTTTTTKKDDATTTTTTTAAAKKGGCKGSIAISALVIAPVLAGGAVLLKKKED